MNSITVPYCEQKAGRKNPLVMEVWDNKRTTRTLDSGRETVKGHLLLIFTTGTKFQVNQSWTEHF